MLGQSRCIRPTTVTTHLASLVVFLTAGLFCLASHAENVVHTQPLTNGNDRYGFAMVQLALSYADQTYTVEANPQQEMTLSRVMKELETGTIDVFWTASDQAFENTFIPVRIPLYKGMFGYRLLIINRDNQARFNHVETLAGLKQLSLGQGRDWADTKILEANGLKVVKVNKFTSLMHMVDGGRFDGFPRGVHEPWNEIETYSDLNLAVEQKIMLAYKMPFYMFVNKNNPKLAQLLESGLKQAIADGSFDKQFLADPSVKKVAEFARLKERKIFELNNPFLTPETPVNQPELWLDINQL